MDQTKTIEGARALALPTVRDLAALLGFAAATVVTAAVIKTPIGVPGHSALFWLPVLVLAGCYPRGGMAVGSAVVGGLAGTAVGRVGGTEFAGLLAAAAVVEAFGLNAKERQRVLPMVCAGLLGHLGKLAMKVISTVAAGLPLNTALLSLPATLALYAAFGVLAGALAWVALAGWRTLPKTRKVREQ